VASDTGWTVLAGLGICAGIALALAASSAPQCCDSTGYHEEGKALLAGGWTGGWLYDKHSYLYGAFHGLMIAAGAGGRVPVAIVQVALLYASVGFLTWSITRMFRTRFVPTLAGLSLVALLPAAAWSGYWLTEAIAAPLILALISSWLLFAMRPGPLGAFAVGIFSTMTWMSRPAFLWLPPLAAIGVLVALRREPLQRRRLSSVAVFLIAFAAVGLPQWRITPSVDRFLHLWIGRFGVWKAPAVFRYATNLSGCGAPAMVFSPLTSELEPIENGTVRAPRSISWSMTAGVAHIVSGWDARPSPTYATVLSQWPWLAVTLLSGFVILAPWKLAANERRRDTATAAFGLLGLFLVAQAQLLTTPTEFRYNLIGWMAGGVALVALGRSIDRRYVGRAAVLTALIVLIGQFTLHYSPAWNRCAG
jgi:hypothetical protein